MINVILILCTKMTAHEVLVAVMTCDYMLCCQLGS